VRWAGPLAAALALVCLNAGCSTHYQPRPGPRLSVVMEGGALAYQRDGETIQHGFFGGGLVEAVESDPAALEAAETYRGRMVGGFVAQLIGIGCFAGGTAWAVSEESDQTQREIFAGSLTCLLAGALTGSILILTAQPYHWDAINIYNDNHVFTGPIAPAYPAYPVPPPAAPPRAPAPPPAPDR
jgi:hypothetical protein